MSAGTPRVVSLLPSATEILCAIGGERLLVGRSHECDFPASVTRLPVLTAARTRFESSAQVDRDVRASLDESQSLYTLDLALLERLRPDVILTQDLCGVCSIDLASVRRLAERISPSPAIVSLNPTTFEGVLDDHLTVGRAVGLDADAEACVVRLRERIYRAAEYVTPFVDGPGVAFLEWTDPIFIGGHWTPQLIERAGARHPLNPTVPVEGAGAGLGPIGETQRAAGKSVRVPAEVLAASRPDVLVVAPCGLSLEQAVRETAALATSAWWAELPAVRAGGLGGAGGAGRVAIVDGNQMFNRPGPRLVDAFEFLVSFLNDRPEVMPAGFPWSRFPVV
jgi:ABC-type Fe3+-hydroxamate transport system substrate-binding protein